MAVERYNRRPVPELSALPGWLRQETANVERAMSALRNRVTDGIFNVTQDFGASGNGLRNDGAQLRDAVEALNAAGGGVLYFPKGRYLNDGELRINTSDVLVLAEPGAVVEQTSTNHTIIARPADGASDFTTLTYYDMTGSPIAIGAETLTMATPADLTTGGFAVGDYIWIRARQTLTWTSGVYQPVAELNKIRALNTTTGVVTLEWPTVKPYVDDVAYPFGIAKAQGAGAIYENIHIRNLEIVNPGPRWPVWVSDVAGFSAKRMKLTGVAGFIPQQCRFVNVSDNHIEISPVNTLGESPYYVTSDTGCSDYYIGRNFCRSKGVGTLHVHEGSANIMVDDNTCLQAKTETYAHALPWGVVNIAALSYNVTVQHNRITNCLYNGIRATDSAPYPAEGHTRLRILHNTIDGVIGERGIYVSPGSTGAVVDDNDVPATCGISSYSIAAPDAIVTNNRGTGTGSVTGANSRVWGNTCSGLQPELSGVSADRGDASVTIRVSENEPVQRFATALTANRTITLSTTKTFNGARFKIVRTGLGAFTLDVGGLKTIPASTAAAVEVTHDGTAWRLTGYELL